MLSRHAKALLRRFAQHEAVFQKIHLLYHLPRVSKELHAFLRQGNTAAASGEYLESDFLLRRLQRRRQTRLGHVKPLCRLGDRTNLSHSDDVFQKLNCHNPALANPQILTCRKPQQPAAARNNRNLLLAQSLTQPTDTQFSEIEDATPPTQLPSSATNPQVADNGRQTVPETQPILHHRRQIRGSPHMPSTYQPRRPIDPCPMDSAPRLCNEIRRRTLQPQRTGIDLRSPCSPRISRSPIAPSSCKSRQPSDCDNTARIPRIHSFCTTRSPLSKGQSCPEPSLYNQPALHDL